MKWLMAFYNWRYNVERREAAIYKHLIGSDANFRPGITVYDEQCFQSYEEFPDRVKKGASLPLPMRTGRKRTILYEPYVDYLYDGKHWHFVGDLRPCLMRGRNSRKDFRNVLKQAKRRTQERRKIA